MVSPDHGRFPPEGSNSTWNHHGGLDGLGQGESLKLGTGVITVRPAGPGLSPGRASRHCPVGQRPEFCYSDGLTPSRWITVRLQPLRPSPCYGPGRHSTHDPDRGQDLTVTGRALARAQPQPRRQPDRPA